MPTEPGADHVRLRLPAVAPMATVVSVAVRVLAGRAGLAESDGEQARAEVLAAFASLADGAAGTTVELVAEVTNGLLVVDLTAPSGSRRFTASR